MNYPFHTLQRTVFGPKLEWLHQAAGDKSWMDNTNVIDWLWKTLPNYSPLPEFKMELMVPEDLPDQQRLMKAGPPLILLSRIVKPMVELDNPLRERVALFWHHHMPTERGKTIEQGLHHWEIFRKHGLGPLRELLLASLTSPAMMRFLGMRYSRKEHPNENFAREFLELHTLGEGHYTLEDVKEAARAFTGYGYLDKVPFPLVLDASNHDDGEKTIFDKKGNFALEDVVDLVLEKPQTAKYIATAAIRFFFSERAPEYMIDHCARVYFESGYELKSLLDCMFHHESFQNPAFCRSKVKSPVELLVAFQRQTGLRTVGLKTDHYILNHFGQIIFGPPTVAGWPGGDQWLRGERLIYRLFLPSSLLDIANRSVPRNSMQYKLTSRIFSPNKRTLRYDIDARWDQDLYKEVLSENGLVESEWLLGEKVSLTNTSEMLQDVRYQYC